MDSTNFLIQAFSLVKVKEPEYIRSAISRAYYAAFHIGRKQLLQMGYKIYKNSVGHQQISSHLNNSGIIEIERISQQLNDARADRNKADYDLDDTSIEDSNTGALKVKRAERIVQTLNDKINKTTRPGIVASINSWLATIAPQKSSPLTP